jgi:hypothetical protein
MEQGNTVSGQLVSAYAAARMLEKDRQTIERATRCLEPDGYERGQPRWRLARIVDALSARAGRGKGMNAEVDPDLQRKFDDLDERYRDVQNGQTLDERRKRARAFFVLVAAVETAMYADARRSGEDPRMAQMRAVEHTRLNVLTLREALGWNSDEAWAEFLKADNRVRNDV